MRRAMRVLILAVSVAGAATAVAAAVPGYSLRVRATGSIKAGRAFNVRVSGTAKRRSVVNVFIDKRKCGPDARSEGNRDLQYRNGDPYFFNRTQGGGQGTIKLPYSSLPQRGDFHESPVAHAGSRHGQWHLCTYLNELDAGSNNARASAFATFSVTG